MKKSFAYPYGVWLAVFILAPILMVVVYAFHNADGGFTLHNFSYLPGYLPIFGRSFWLAFLSTAVCLVLGYPMAYLMSRLSASKQSLCMMLIMLPMWINFLLRTYAWMSILENNGFINQFFRSIGLISFLQSHFGYSLDYIPLINTQGAIVLGMVYNFLPFMVLPIYTVLIKLDRKLIEAAQDLGAPTHLVFRRVIFPLSIPGVISGITMVFVPSVSTFVISQMLGSGKNLLVGDLIDLQFMGGAYNPHLGSTIALVMIILIFICMWIMNKSDDGSSEEGGLLL
ncbi:ABC transporter permease [Agathobaculum butyriciproducens]|uniref:ABC transporter permease n=1 Tax=Agathobaculum butyriciproducens TaxID=1628085 RepID=UPI001D08EC46|nr:ABC transporter permease [Agathobaculum butyriciproducens]MCQ5047229.1 ABC transporter permease [Agathobaculum butyriciproducens]